MPLLLFLPIAWVGFETQRMDLFSESRLCRTRESQQPQTNRPSGVFALCTMTPWINKSAIVKIDSISRWMTEKLSLVCMASERCTVKLRAIDPQPGHGNRSLGCNPRASSSGTQQLPHGTLSIPESWTDVLSPTRLVRCHIQIGRAHV